MLAPTSVLLVDGDIVTEEVEERLCQDLEARVRGAGYKLTRARRAVISAVVGSDGAPSATDILLEAKRHCPGIGLATVYRTLDILDRVRGAERVHRPDGYSGFVACPASDHHHVVCRVCGRVAEFYGCTVAEMIPSVGAQTGFTVEDHMLELVGTCGACRSRLARSGEGEEK